MSNCILCEYYSSTGYHCEIVEKDKFDITQMDKRWEELFFFPMNQELEFGKFSLHNHLNAYLH